MATQETTTQSSPPEASARTAAAQALITKVRALRDEIPDFTAPSFLGDARILTNAASVSTAFVERTLVAVTNTRSLLRPDALDPVVSRDLIAFGDAFTPLADELEALALFVRHSVASARHKAGTDALTTYALAQRLAKRAETAAELAPHVDDMRHALGRRRKAKQPVTPVPAPAPTVPPAKLAVEPPS
jgi:hypothetical protein